MGVPGAISSSMSGALPAAWGTILSFSVSEFFMFSLKYKKKLSKLRHLFSADVTYILKSKLQLVSVHSTVVNFPSLAKTFTSSLPPGPLLLKILDSLELMSLP